MQRSNLDSVTEKCLVKGSTLKVKPHTLHSRAVSIICVASKLWMKFGGNADACLTALTIRKSHQ